jgi:hypothetical protein
LPDPVCPSAVDQINSIVGLPALAEDCNQVLSLPGARSEGIAYRTLVCRTGMLETPLQGALRNAQRTDTARHRAKAGHTMREIRRLGIERTVFVWKARVDPCAYRCWR